MNEAQKVNEKVAYIIYAISIFSIILFLLISDGYSTYEGQFFNSLIGNLHLLDGCWFGEYITPIRTGDSKYALNFTTHCKGGIEGTLYTKYFILGSIALFIYGFFIHKSIFKAPNFIIKIFKINS